jgi:XTP/dITP diphosphohydrolase
MQPLEPLTSGSTPELKKHLRLLLASSNPGKLQEFRALARDAGSHLELESLPGIDRLAPHEEDADTFGENALGKALHYSRHSREPVFCDDSGLVVPALDGKPGVHSARYAGPSATNSQRIEKLLEELRGKSAEQRSAHFVCVIALAQQGKALAIVSDSVDGVILEAPRGSGGFGYDPVFYYPPLHKTFAELSPEEKNRHSHRGKAFLRLLAALPDVL